MRHVLLLIPLLAAPLAARAAEPATACPKPTHIARQTWQQHFAAANLAHDGHLTAEEAKSGYPDVARHFEDIDVEHKGFVTENDLRAWQIMRKAVHRLGKPPEDKALPRTSAQRADPDFRTLTISGQTKL